jgi:glycosyltransferase involved in cell wall biosynthesis
MKISVIVPVYNNAHHLSRVVQALLQQDYPRDRYELIFVDNGSVDNSLEILQRCPELSVYSEAEPGSYAARNRGISHARGEILAFTDSDCFPHAGWLKSIDRALSADHAKLVLGPRLSVGSSSCVRLLASYENNKTQLVCRSDDPSVYYGYTNNMAVKKPVMDRIGPFLQLDRGADTIFVSRVAQTFSCDAVSYCPEMFVQHAELNSVRNYCKKMKTYGRSRTANHHILPVRSLNTAERWKAFRTTARGLGLVDSAKLFSLLALGAGAWWFGLYGFSGRGARAPRSRKQTGPA